MNYLQKQALIYALGLHDIGRQSSMAEFFFVIQERISVQSNMGV